MNDMNDIAKQSAAGRLRKALELEKLGSSSAARQLNILPQYISMALNEKFWDKMPKSAWDRILLWVNSGETLHHFKIPIGEPVKEEKRKELPPKIISRTPIQNTDNKLTVPPAVNKIEPKQEQQFTDTARLKVCLDIEINLVINGQKIQIK